MAPKKTPDTKETKADAKLAASMEKEAAQSLALTKMQPLAKAINVRMEKAQKNDALADDHRLAASLHLAEAKKIAEEAGVSFKTWCDENVTQDLLSYESARKLAAVGAAKDPALALADLRAGNASANKKHRAKKKAAANAKPDGKQGTKINDPFKHATAALDMLDDKGALSLTQSRAKRLGMVMLPEGEAKKLRSIENGGLDWMKSSFDKLKASDKMTFAAWAAKEIGGTFTSEFDAGAPAKVAKGEAGEAGKMPEIPTTLRRRQPKSAEAKAA